MGVIDDIDCALGASSTTGARGAARITIRLATANAQRAFAKAWGRHFGGPSGSRTTLMQMVEDGDCTRLNRTDFIFTGIDAVEAAEAIAATVQGCRVVG